MAEDILSKIKDPKLRDDLNIYRESGNGFALIDILEHFNIRFRVDAFEAILPKFEVNGNKIHLGGFIINSTLYGVYLEVSEQKLTIRIGVEYYVLISRENKPKNGDKSAKR
jgi:hypothetical protein